MLFIQQDDGARGLGVEGAGDVEDRIFDDLLDAGVRDWGGGLESVVGAAVFDGGGEGFCGCHSYSSFKGREGCEVGWTGEVMVLKGSCCFEVVQLGKERFYLFAHGYGSSWIDWNLIVYIVRRDVVTHWQLRAGLSHALSLDR